MTDVRVVSSGSVLRIIRVHETIASGTYSFPSLLLICQACYLVINILLMSLSRPHLLRVSQDTIKYRHRWFGRQLTY